jgi:hypothetical protein
MTLIRNLFFLISLTIFALATFVICLFNYNPEAASKSVFLTFYLSLGLTMAGILTILIYYIKLNWLKDTAVNSQFWPSVRQALLIAGTLTILLFLQGVKIFDWLIGISIIIVVSLLELFFQTKKGRS